MGVSLYSYQDEFLRRDMNLKDCIEAVSDMGATGIELLPDEMIRDCYNISDDFINQWKEWMTEFGTVPVAIDGFCDERGLWKKQGHEPTLEDALFVQKRYLEIADKLGVKYIRTQINDMDLLRKMVPLAEEKDIILCLEVHAPLRISDQIIQDWVELKDELGTNHLGLIPDFGIFEQQSTPVILRQCIRDGMSEAVINEAAEKKALGWSFEEARDYFTKQNVTSGDLDGVWRVYNVNPEDPEELRKLMPYVIGFHGKFWNMLDDMSEESINYKEPLRVILESGFEGFICSEYEGGRHIQDIEEVRGVEQVRRHHVMLRNLIEELENEIQ